MKKFESGFFMNNFFSIAKYWCFAFSLLIGGCAQLNNAESQISLTDEEVEFLKWCDKCDYPPLNLAISSLQFNVARYLVLNGADVNVEDSKGMTPLFYFGETQQDPDDYIVDFKSMGEFLIDHGANINHRDHEGNTPLHIAVDNSRIAELLISRGADVNARNNKGVTPLHLAAYFLRYNRPTKSIEILLKAKADVNAQDNEGLTPLHYSVKSDNYKACDFLLRHGADNTITNNQRNSPLDVARKEHRFDLMCLLSNTEGYSKSLQYRDFFLAINNDDVSYFEYYLNKKTIDGFIKKYAISPLILATMLNKVKVAKFLISRGADVTVKCDLPKNYQYLGENDVDVEAYKHMKWTPLHIAVNKSWENEDYLEMVKLLANKQTVNIKDVRGDTPLSLAKPGSEVAKILIANGAKKTK